MSNVPKNIRDMVGQNEMYARRVADTMVHQKTSACADWHERDQRRLTSRPALSTATATSGIAFGSTPALRDAGIKSGVETAKAARQARLKEKLEGEMVQYEAELNAMGLALAKPRD